jgi:DNA-directed RNA polymerase alpha subunit
MTDSSDFFAKLSAPARRALDNQGITTLQDLAKYSEKEILKLHGMGPASLPVLRASLEGIGLAFKE